MDPRTFTLVRHGRTTYNDERRVNGDPTIPVELTDEGRAQCAAVGERLAARHFDLAVHTRFPRTRQSLAIILGGRRVPMQVFPEFDDVRLGDLEGRPIDEYREWRRGRRPDEPPPGEGESRLGVLARYAAGYERLVDAPAARVLCVAHDVTVRFMANAAAGHDPLDGPVKRIENAQVVELGEDELRAGIARMRDRLGW
ncbi:MAG TPA: histidine phosphatase family protein [Miltoncostaeaceae bacterium]|nr:histidine phosphatase family protein [Miltoncostaeaceae bacterium]